MKQVKIGIGFGLWRLGMPAAETIVSVAERAEDWGLDSFWLSDHLLAPSPELDVVATLSLLASRTTRMKLGPSVLLLNLRHPLMVAKSFASLDYMSGGRMVMAVGTGANLAEADLIAAKLGGAILTGANLHEADLLGADLTDTQYSAQDLNGALHVPQARRP